MVASRQVEIPHYRGVGRERGMGFGALAEVIGRTADPFLHKYVGPTMWSLASVKRDLNDFLGPKMTPITWILKEKCSREKRKK